MPRRATAFILLLVFAFVAMPNFAHAKSGQDDMSLRKGESRTTMDPSMFRHPMINEAYQAAKDIPGVLDSIYCFCYCKESFGHKSLLSCYVDLHAAR